jgi:hypothetical protein
MQLQLKQLMVHTRIPIQQRQIQTLEIKSLKTLYKLLTINIPKHTSDAPQRLFNDSRVSK